MSINRKINIYRKIAVALAGIMLAETAFPTISLALTAGPASPEFSSFEPVSTTSMVNDFSGDFTYNLPVLNVPGANGGGYALSLSYHSGESPESEASWVGYGWTLNPGSITRSKRGLADDSKGDAVTYYNRVPKNWTVSLGAQVGVEAFSGNLGIDANAGIRYNNYRGFSFPAGAGLSFVKGLASLGYSVSDGNGSFSVNINPSVLLKRGTIELEKTLQSEEYKAAECDEETKLKKAAKKKDFKRNLAKGTMNSSFSFASSYGMYALSDISMPTHVTQYVGTSVNMKVSFDPHASPLPIAPQVGFTGNYTSQENIPVSIASTYGYLYSGYATTSSVMDYHSEKEALYTKRDRYLSIPFSNADQYAVSGEGLSGAFRLHSTKAGTFYPNETKSETYISQSGIEIHAGVNVGAGVSLGTGKHTLEVKRNWSDGSSTYNGNTSLYDFDTDMGSYYFRFNGDMGGEVDYGNFSAPKSAHIIPDNIEPGIMAFHPNVQTGYTPVYAADPKKNSSFIGFHTNNEMLQAAPSTKEYKRYERSPETVLQVNRSTVPDGIGEIVTYNEAGNRYVYGLPVYSRNEKTMQYDLHGATSVDHNYIAYKDISSPDMEVGESHPTPYATNYLLTEITTPDYIDRNLNGPDDEDLGGYTKFIYDQAHGSYDKPSGTGWYKWRIPYTGLSYNPASLTDNTDDLGTLMSGEKEIYYLKQIETKTHIAVFVTNQTTFTISGKTFNGASSISGSLTSRPDGLGAADDNTAATSSTAKDATKEVRKLERIELYAKPAAGSNDYKLVKTVRMEYDNSLCQGLPNTLTSNTGKLTLKKVWFEYEGVVNARISPYRFEYAYPTTSTSNYPARYTSPDNLYMPTGLVQNPNYNYFMLDAWGNYQDGGAARFDNMQKWVDQTPNTTTFDPAAWQLKVIKLPSGGEIHVQYEQDDYMYVQDKKAMAMVKLLGKDNDRYYIDVDNDLGLTQPEKDQLVQQIKSQFQDEKIYFKFLYKLLPGSGAALGDCSSDYITGYANLLDAGVEDTGPFTGKVFISLGGGSAGAYELPDQVCQDYVKTEKGGKLKPGGNCNASDGGLQDNNDAGDVIRQLLAKIATLSVPASTCATFEPSLSYFRVPVLHGKKGGGLRVKRVLMYDKGIDPSVTSGDESLYGTEYIYEGTDGESSGVATNEPSAIREENALVGFLLKRNDQHWWQRAISGKDKEQFEGPIGESILPVPSVGYSRVIIKNIHGGNTGTGYVINEFFTSKDYPFSKNYSTNNISGPGNDHTSIEQQQDWLLLPAGFINYSVTNLWATQGYRFIINEMHGQPKATSTYAGDYAGTPLTAPASQVLYHYFAPGEGLPVMKDVNTIQYEYPGRETEVVFERKAVEDITKDGSLDLDTDVGFLAIPTPFFSFMPSLSYSESKLRTHITSKIINFPAVQKSVSVYTDGIWHTTENIAFSELTGQPVVTRTTDGYDGADLQQSQDHNGMYYSYAFPAAQQYTEMGQKSASEGKVILAANPLSPGMSLQQVSGQYELKFTAPLSGSLCSFLELFSKGDLVRLTTSSSSFFHVDGITGNRLRLLPSGSFNAASNSNISTGTVSMLEIIRSGRTNQLSTMAGAITTYGSASPATVYHPMNSTLKSTGLAVATTLDGITNGGTTSSLNIIDPNNGQCALKAVTITGTVTSDGKLQVHVGTPGVEGCTETLSAAGGDFQMDTLNGKLVYYAPGNSCFPEVLTCVKLCSKSFGYNTIDVVASSAATFDHEWSYDAALYPTVSTAVLNAYEAGTKGRWRTSSMFTYNTSVIGGSKQSTTERNYKNAGVYGLTMFDWKDETHNDAAKWLKGSTVIRYSPHGEAEEEKDILGVYSSAKYGYNEVLPYLVAKNSPYTSAQFESFEKSYTGPVLEEGVSISSTSRIDNATAHSGKASFKLLNNCSGGLTGSSCALTMKAFQLDAQLITNGLSVKVWVKDPGGLNKPVKGVMTKVSTSTTLPLDLVRIARTGEWSLYEAKTGAIAGGFIAGDNVTITLYSGYSYSTLLSTVWIDDVRIQPADAMVMTYVYDVNTLRLLTSFDDQHFGMYYQYNQEGQLVRKQVETEKGMKTIQETQYHVPLEHRNTP